MRGMQAPASPQSRAINQPKESLQNRGEGAAITARLCWVGAKWDTVQCPAQGEDRQVTAPHHWARATSIALFWPQLYSLTLSQPSP